MSYVPQGSKQFNETCYFFYFFFADIPRSFEKIFIIYYYKQCVIGDIIAWPYYRKVYYQISAHSQMPIFPKSAIWRKIRIENVQFKVVKQKFCEIQSVLKYVFSVKIRNSFFWTKLIGYSGPKWYKIWNLWAKKQ